MGKAKTKSEKTIKGEELGKKLLQSVQEMKAGKAVRVLSDCTKRSVSGMHEGLS